MKKEVKIALGLTGLLVTSILIYRWAERNAEKGRCTELGNGLIMASVNC